MNPNDALRLCQFVRSACPQQAIDQHTPEAWAVLLADVRIEDATAAAAAVAKRAPFVAPSEIIAEVKRIRAKRLENHPPPEPPSDLAPGDYLAWLRDARRRIADGEQLDVPAALTGPERNAHRARLAQLMTKPRTPPAPVDDDQEAAS